MSKKEEGDALACGSYRVIRLLEHAMKVRKRVIERRLWIYGRYRSTTDAIFIVRQLQEKYLANNKKLWMAFDDLKKAFDRLPRQGLEPGPCRF